MDAGVDRSVVCAEMEQARRDFGVLLAQADGAGLRRRSDGTRWTNRQLLFHMLFGFLLVRVLLVVMSVFGRLPGGVGRGFAWLLDSARAPFHVVNYLASCVGAAVISPGRMPGMMDWVAGALERRLRRETPAALSGGMYYPPGWDPFFPRYMTRAALYRYPAQHFRFHQRQLTLPQPRG